MAIDFAAGWLGGCMGLFAGHPFDTVKVRLQTQGVSGQYKGTLDCFLQIIKKESPLALYKGVTSPLFGVALINGIVFGTFGPALRFLQSCSQQKRDESSSHHSQYFKIAAAGAVAGFVQSFVCSPVELAKTMLQVQKEKYVVMSSSQHNVVSSLYKGPIDVLWRLIKHDGIRGFYRGLFPTILRDVPSFAMYFSSYTFFCNCLAQEGQSENDLLAWKVILAGGSAGCVSWVINIPIDVVKSRMQADSITEPKYRGFLDCMLKIYRNEGSRALFRGLVPILLRAFPTNGTTFVVYSFSFQYMNLLQKDRL